LKGFLAWNRQWYALDGVDHKPLPYPYPEIILPESLSAWRESEGLGSTQKFVTFAENLLKKGPNSFDISELDGSEESHTEAEIIADFPRQTWIPVSLLDEWPTTQSNRGLLIDHDLIADLVTLFESVCGPLGNENLGWQRIPGMDMAQLFAVPLSISTELHSPTGQWSLHNASVLWAQYWMEAVRNTEIKGRHIAIILGDRDFSLWIYKEQRFIHHGRYLWNTLMDILYHVLARRSDREINCIHFLQQVAWTAEERGILDTSFDHVFIQPGASSNPDSDLSIIRLALTHSLQQWNQKYG